jgi:hypothetical protein
LQPLSKILMPGPWSAPRQGTSLGVRRAASNPHTVLERRGSAMGSWRRTARAHSAHRKRARAVER